MRNGVYKKHNWDTQRTSPCYMVYVNGVFMDVFFSTALEAWDYFMEMGGIL